MLGNHCRRAPCFTFNTADRAAGEHLRPFPLGCTGNCRRCQMGFCACYTCLARSSIFVLDARLTYSPGVASYRPSIETVFGRRLYVPEINSRNAQRRQYAERTAINAPMQGTAADIIKRAMLSLDGWLRESGAAARMIMQVHDELVLEVEEGAVDSVREATVERMQAAAELRVPLVVEVGLGANWDQAH